MRFHPNGTPDLDFGLNGSVDTDVDAGHDNIGFLAVGADGKIIVTGSAYAAPTSTSTRGFILQYDSEGVLDGTFDNDGKLISSDISSYGPLVVQPDGKIAAIGRTTGNYFLTRFEADGDLDAAFGVGGRVNLGSDFLSNQLVMHNNHFLIAQSLSMTVYMRRFDSSGDLDASYGGDGILSATFNRANIGDDLYVMDYAVQADDKPIVVGYGSLSFYQPLMNLFVLRFTETEFVAPAALNATLVSPTQIDLTWTDNSSDETSFRIQRSPNGSTGWTEIASNSANDTTYSDTGLTCGTMYYYRVRAHRSSDNRYSSYSSEDSEPTNACLPPEAPDNLSAIAFSKTQIDLMWDDNSSDETSFRIQRSLNGSTGWTQIASNSANDADFSNTGLTCGTTYYYRVHAHRAGDSQYSSYSNIANATTADCPPAAPIGLNATAVSQTQIDLTWIDVSLNETSFKIERSLNGSTGWTEIASNSANDTTYLDIGLTCGTRYYYRVRAHRSGDNQYSTYSSTDSATTDICPPPNPPGTLAASLISSTQIDLIWTDNSDDETSFKIERSPNGSTGWTEIASNAANDTTYSDSSLTCGIYYYRIRAHRSDDDQYSDYSNTAYEVTVPCNLFTDVPTLGKEFMQPYIETFYLAGITTGCGVSPLNYCPEQPVTRAAMSVFILRAMNYPNLPYTPTDTEPDLFSDVPTTNKEWMEPWIEEFYTLGITGGCGQAPLRFCPENSVTRAALAVFILRALEGSDYEPEPSPNVFADLPVAGKEWMEPWVNEFYERGFTTGCGVSPLRYCPEDPVTRGAMSVFILRAFDHLPKP